MKLSEIPNYNDICVGDVVVSEITGNRGVISFYPEALDEENNPWIKISWANGNISTFPFVDDGVFLFENITYIGKETTHEEYISEAKIKVKETYELLEVLLKKK